MIQPISDLIDACQKKSFDSMQGIQSAFDLLDLADKAHAALQNVAGALTCAHAAHCRTCCDDDDERHSPHCGELTELVLEAIRFMPQQQVELLFEQARKIKRDGETCRNWLGDTSGE